MQRDRLFDTAHEFLCHKLTRYLDNAGKRDSVDPKALIAAHLAVPNKPKSMKEVYRRALESAQNRAGSSNVISGCLPNQTLDDLRATLHDFDPKSVASQEYASQDLLDQIKKDVGIKGKVLTSALSLWPQFCKSAISSANFLARFQDFEAFDTWVSSFSLHIETAPALPLILSEEIHGFGIALACDFLKELGYGNYGKPDTHVNAILEAVFRSTGTSNYFNLLRLLQIANECRQSAFAMDKVLWLIGSGNFYLTPIDGTHPLKIGNNRAEFIRHITANRP